MKAPRLRRLMGSACLATLPGALLCTAMLTLPLPGRAQGIPVLDTANLVSAIQRLQSSITQINTQYQQIRQLYDQLNAMSRARGLGDVLNNPALQNYIPRDAANLPLDLIQPLQAQLTGHLFHS